MKARGMKVSAHVRHMGWKDKDEQGTCTDESSGQVRHKGRKDKDDIVPSDDRTLLSDASSSQAKGTAPDQEQKGKEKEMSERIEAIARQEVCGREFTVYGTIEEPLFLASDVAKWIDSRNPSQMTKMVDDDEKLTYTMYMAGQSRECLFLTENGLYEVLMLSRKPIAKQFKKEVKRVLHELRVNGAVVTVRTATAPSAVQMASFQKAMEAAVQHAMEVADGHYAPLLEQAEAERDAARRERGWISRAREATALQRNSVYARRLNKIEREKEELEDRLNSIGSMLDADKLDAGRYRSWRSHVGRRPKGWKAEGGQMTLL